MQAREVIFISYCFIGNVQLRVILREPQLKKKNVPLGSQSY